MNPDRLPIELAELARSAPSQLAFRAEALATLQRTMPFDGAFFHALNPRVPLATGAARGIDPAPLFASVARWDRYATELARWREAARASGGVAVDRHVFTAPERDRIDYFRTVAQPLGSPACALVHLEVRGRLVSAIGLFRAGTSADFHARELARLRDLIPVLAVADASYPPAPTPATPSPAPALTPREREIVEYVSLGYRNEDIARALGLSPNTVRNRLAALFERLGVANRAELVRAVRP